MFRSKTESYVSSSVSRKSDVFVTPALLTRVSSPPRASAAASTVLSHSATLLRSPCIVAALPPSSSNGRRSPPARSGRSGRPPRRPGGRARRRCPGLSPCPRPLPAPSSPRGCSPVRTLAFLPALGEQVEVDVLFRMRFYYLFVQFDAEARSLRKFEVAVHDLGEAGGRLPYPGVGEVVEVFLDAEVRGRGGQVEGCRGVDLSSHVVRRDGHVVRVGPRRELLGLQQPADVAYIGLYHVGGLKLEELPVFQALVDALARGNGGPYAVGGLLQGLEVDRRHRLLDPTQSEGLEHAGHLYGRGRGEAAVHLQQDLDLRSYGVPDGFNERDGPHLLPVLQLVVAWAEGI